MAQAQRLLSLIGLEHIAGYLPIDAINQWKARGNSLEHIQKMDVVALRQRIQQEHIHLLDVRGASEYTAGHIEEAKNIPLGYLEHHLQEIPTDQAIAVYCQAGTRSAIAVSILVAHGFKQSIDVLGGFAAWQKTGDPVEKEQYITLAH